VRARRLQKTRGSRTRASRNSLKGIRSQRLALTRTVNQFAGHCSPCGLRRIAQISNPNCFSYRLVTLVRRSRSLRQTPDYRLPDKCLVLYGDWRALELAYTHRYAMACKPRWTGQAQPDCGGESLPHFDLRGRRCAGLPTGPSIICSSLFYTTKSPGEGTGSGPGLSFQAVRRGIRLNCNWAAALWEAAGVPDPPTSRHHDNNSQSRRRIALMSRTEHVLLVSGRQAGLRETPPGRAESEGYRVTAAVTPSKPADCWKPRQN